MNFIEFSKYFVRQPFIWRAGSLNIKTGFLPASLASRREIWLLFHIGIAFALQVLMPESAPLFYPDP
jgi:hypothetical protein